MDIGRNNTRFPDGGKPGEVTYEYRRTRAQEFVQFKKNTDFS